jgi:GNAT superfamily N-acetyltransferase
MELIYQEEKEAKPIYDMYQKIFEDPEPFAEYYFEEIYATNEVLLAKREDKILGMIHLNPYHIRAGKKIYTLNYIVAVAVWKEYRRQGIMAVMLKKCLNDMHQKKQPFTYLMPANRAYYEPFQFRFVMDWKESMIYNICGSAKEDQISKDNKIIKVQEEHYEQIKIFLEQFMKPYQIYTVPDQRYLKRLSKESQSGDGNLMAYYEGKQLQGVFAESFEEDEVYIRWAYSLKPKDMLDKLRQRYQNKKIYITEGNITQGEKVPKIMARITNLTAWEEILRGKKDFTFRLLIKDPYIKDQDGVFLFQCLNHKISIQRIDVPEWEDEVSIDELTQVFFDYDAEQILKQHEYLKDIVPAGPIYISEEV